MIPFIRRQKILEILHESEIVYIEDLIKATKVSDATIRRDLKTLSEEGHVDLLAGGAARLKVRMGERPLDERVNINKDEKELIGRYAAMLVNDGDFIFIGPGTTENTMLEGLGGKNVTIVTNGAFHIDACIKNQIDVIILGGRIINSIAVLSGPSAIEQVKSMHFDKCFIGCSGLTMEGSMTTSDENVAVINSVAIKNSNVVYFMADSTKFGKASRFEFATTHSDHTLITNRVPDGFHGEGQLIIID